MQTTDALKPHLIERFKVDSGTIAAIGYERGVCVIEFHTGALFAYPMTAEDFEKFARAESKGQYFNQQIRGKVKGAKLTGQCPQCGSNPEIIGEICSDCGTATAVPVVSKREAARYGESE